MAEENKHIPKYIREKPWYVEGGKNGPKDEQVCGKDYLDHHRLHRGGELEDHSIAKRGNDIKDLFLELEDGGRRRGGGRRGGKGKRCASCGSQAHLTRDCLERPRKQRKAKDVVETHKFTVREESGLGFDAKRDRWFGYSGEDYDELLKRSRERDMASAAEKKEVEIDFDEQVEKYKLGLELAENIPKMDSNGELLPPSIRLRGDKAQYLNDLGTDVTKYDPKSRLYKSEDIGEVDPKTKMFHRHLKGESAQLAELNKRVRDIASHSGIRDDVEDTRKTEHVLAANPTKYELMLLREKQEQAVVDTDEKTARRAEGRKQDDATKRSLLEHYGS